MASEEKSHLEPSPSPPPPLPPHLILMVTRRTTVMRMMPQPMPPMMLRNGSIASTFGTPPPPPPGGGGRAPAADPGGSPAESSVDCFSGRVAAAPRAGGFSSPSAVLSDGEDTTFSARVGVMRYDDEGY